MANDVLPGDILATRPVQGGRAPTGVGESVGKTPPPSGIKLPPVKPTVIQTEAQKAKREADLAALAKRVAEYFRESGRPISFKVEQAGGRTVVQKVDPDSGEVIGELTSEDLLALAHGLGLAGLMIDSHV